MTLLRGKRGCIFKKNQHRILMIRRKIATLKCKPSENSLYFRILLCLFKFFIIKKKKMYILKYMFTWCLRYSRAKSRSLDNLKLRWIKTTFLKKLVSLYIRVVLILGIFKFLGWQRLIWFEIKKKNIPQVSSVYLTFNLWRTAMQVSHLNNMGFWHWKINYLFRLK